MPSRSSRSTRGFVILVVLLMLVVISAVAVGQLAVVQNEQVISVRKEEEAQARAIAEGCLALLTKHATQFSDPDNNPNTGPPSDFDRLLNPNGSIARSGDEHIPAGIGGTAVKLLPTSPGTSQHQWLLIPRSDGDPLTPDGACLVRYEDNSDDAYDTSAAMTDGNADCDAAENPVFPLQPAGIDIPWCDRDGSIYLTAIGLYPFQSAPADAYAKAHARVTLRKLFATAKPSSFAPGLQAGGSIDIKNNVRICGAGGIAASDVNGAFGGTSCVCGGVTSTSPPVAVPISASCGACSQCNPGSIQSPVAGPKPFEINHDNSSCVPGGAPVCAQHSTDQLMPSSPMQPLFAADFMSADGFGDPRSNIVAPGLPNLPTDPGAQTCEFFFDENNAAPRLTDGIYYWDSSDTDTTTTFTTTRYPGLGASVIPAENCATVSYTNTVPKPCTWDFTANTVTCAIGESACWKPLANLNGAGAEDIEIGTNSVPAMDTAGDNLAFSLNAIPNAADINAKFDTTPTAPDITLCGSNAIAPGSCSNCTGLVGSVDHTANAGNDFVLKGNNTNMPVPAFMAVVDTGGGAALELTNTGNGDTRPLNVTVLVQGDINFNGTNGLCGARVDCRAMTARTIPAANCRINPYPANVPSFDWDPNGVGFPLPGGGNPQIPSYVIKLTGPSGTTINNGNTFLGLVRTNGDLTMNGDTCYVGRVMADGDLAMAGATSVIGVRLMPDALQNNGQILVIGDIEGRNNVTVRADLFGEDDLKFKNNFTLIGRVAVNDDIDLKNNASIDWNGGGVAGAFGNSALSSFIESQW